MLELSRYGVLRSNSLLKDLNERYQPLPIFLMESKNIGTFYEKIRKQVGMDKPEYIGLRGNARGLALWWWKNVDVNVMYYNFIYASILLVVKTDRVSLIYCL